MGSARHRDPGGGSRDAPACTEDAVGSPRAHPKPETSQQLWGLYSEQIPRSAVPEDAGQKTASCVCVWLPPPEKDHVMRRQVPGQQPAGGRGRWAGCSARRRRVGFPTMSEPLSAFPGPGRGMSHGLRASPALRPPVPHLVRSRVCSWHKDLFLPGTWMPGGSLSALAFSSWP